MSRNPLIFGLFTRMHLVERVASGVPRMRDGMFTVVFMRPEKLIENIEGVNEGVNLVEKRILNQRKRGFVSTRAYQNNW